MTDSTASSTAKPESDPDPEQSTEVADESNPDEPDRAPGPGPDAELLIDDNILPVI